MKRPPETCPNCGAEVPRSARACPECGADEDTGWGECAYVNDLDLPDEKFNYDEFLKREFGDEKPSPIPAGIAWYWWVAAILLLAAILALWVF